MDKSAPRGHLEKIFFFILMSSCFAFLQMIFNPTALRKAKIVYNFGLSECNRVKVIHTEFSMTVLFLNGLLYEFL